MIESVMRWPIETVPLGILPGLCILIAYVVHRFQKSNTGDDVSSLQGPTSSSWLFGNVEELSLAIPWGETMMVWFQKYGDVFKGYGFFSEELLLVSDPTAIRHIFANPSVFQKTAHHQFMNIVLCGSGSLFYTQGEEHRRLRAISNPMFSSANVRSLKPLLIQTARELVDSLSNISDPLVDMYRPIHETTLRGVTEALMGDERGSIESYRSAYDSLVLTLALAQKSKTAMMSAIIVANLPAWAIRLIINHPPALLKRFYSHRTTARNVSMQLLRKQDENPNKEASGLFDHFVNANNKADKILTEDELLDQFGTLTIAGEDSTASAILWALYQLTLNPDWQHKIRVEIREALVNQQSESLDYDKLVYLNAFIKEVLRYYPILPITERIVSTDTVIPISRSVETAFGDTLNKIRTKKGRSIWISVMAYNRSLSVWGSDANEFKPSRWLNNGSVASESSIGPYANILSFLGGPRSCLGWRFAVLEMQVILAEISKTFLFALADNVTIRPALAIVLVPVDGSGKTSLPLKFERVD